MGVEYINLDLTQPQDFEKLPKENVEGVILLGPFSCECTCKLRL